MLLAQINPISGDIEGNLEKIHKFMDKCTTSPGETLILPAYALTGWPLGDLATSKSFITQVHKALRKLQRKDHYVLTCIPDGAGGSTPVLISENDVQYGNRFSVTAGLTIAVSVSFEPVLCDGADMLVVLDAKPFRSNAATETLEHARTFASRIRMPLIYTNLVGANDSVVYAGGSFMLDMDGGFVECLPLWEEGISRVDDISWPWTSEPENTWRALTMGVANFVEKNGYDGVTLGVSGGFDSAICAAIAADALGPDKVHGIMMPSDFTSKSSLADADEVAKCLGIKFDKLSIKEPVVAFEKSLAPMVEVLDGDTMQANLQARIRGAMLMAIANKEKSLLMVTGNKSECSIGYTTLYGDMCGDMAPLKDVYKTDAYALAKWRNSHVCKWMKNPVKQIMPDHMITKAPIPEWHPNQPDFGTLPEYEMLDKILKAIIENDTSVEELINQGYDSKVVLKIRKLIDQAEYKRQQSAAGIKVSKRSFDVDWNYPITKRI
ncbi:MAG: NAD(+) synthase [Alphaproteobacteria bacterium]|nr:NAD(+) synthase [Alphaproteobacteria bacterium]